MGRNALTGINRILTELFDGDEVQIVNSRNALTGINRILTRNEEDVVQRK